MREATNELPISRGFYFFLLLSLVDSVALERILFSLTGALRLSIH